MRRVIAIAVGGASLAGCSSFSWDFFKSAPPTDPGPAESVPPGADAATSVGPGCKTPCSVAVAAPDAGFSVTFTLPKFQPVTVPVQVIHNPGDFATPASTTIDPNPVVAELQPAGPPPKAASADGRKSRSRRQPQRPRPHRPAARPSPIRTHRHSRAADSCAAAL